MLRKTIGVLTGITIAVLIFMGFEHMGGILYPLPPGTDIADHAAMEAYTASLPTSALLLVLAGWAVGSFICGVVIKIIDHSNSKTPAYIAGLFLMTAGIVDIFIVPHPVWFIITGVVLFIPLSILGHSIIKK